MKPDILNIENLTLKIGDKRVLDSVSINIRKGEIFTLVGESGSGKSLTALAIMRLLPNEIDIESGDVIFKNSSLFELPEYKMRKIRGSKISMVFQEPMSALNPVIVVGEQVREVLEIHKDLESKGIKRRVIELFSEVGLKNSEIKYDSYPHQLSGGEKQRVMIAMALACEPELLIADEPTTALDVTIQKKILKLLKDIQQKRNLTILFITHDMGVVYNISDRVAVMRDGEILEISDRLNFFNRPTHPYTRELLESFNSLGSRVNGSSFSKNILDIRDLVVKFRVRRGVFGRVISENRAVDGVNLSIKEGKSLALVGESGSGKSTIAKAILRLIDIDGGDILFRGESIGRVSQKEMLRYRSKIQIIFQDPYSSLNPRMSIGEIIREGMVSLGIYKLSREVQDRTIRELLIKVGLKEEHIDRYPHQFSGGQRQRINIARALAVEPELIICDEPTSALDLSVRVKILNLLKKIQREEGISYLFITHDLASVPLIADEIAILNRGKIVEYGKVKEVMERPKDSYSRELISSILSITT